MEGGLALPLESTLVVLGITLKQRPNFYKHSKSQQKIPNRFLPTLMSPVHTAQVAAEIHRVKAFQINFEATTQLEITPQSP